MKKTHGNCAGWTQETETHVLCKPDMLPECWYSKHGNAKNCKCWKARIVDLHLRMWKLEVEYFEGYTTPHFLTAFCTNGKKYNVQPSHVTQVRIAGWTCDHYHYTEMGEQRYRQTWHGSPLDIVVVSESEIG